MYDEVVVMERVVVGAKAVAVDDRSSHESTAKRLEWFMMVEKVVVCCCRVAIGCCLDG